MRAYLADLAAKSANIGTLGLAEPQVSPRQIAMLYGIALAAVAIALGVRLALATPLADESPYLFFVPAVLVAAGIGGGAVRVYSPCDLGGLELVRHFSSVTSYFPAQNCGQRT